MITSELAPLDSWARGLHVAGGRVSALAGYRCEPDRPALVVAEVSRLR